MKKFLSLFLIGFLCLSLVGCGSNNNEQKETLTSEILSARLKDITNISKTCIITETNDTNGKLNKSGGYIGAVYFTYDLVEDQSAYDDDFNLITNPDSCQVGVNGGGEIEIYENSKDAKNRDDYLSNFDGGLLASFHKIYEDKYLIRLSDELSASEQNNLYEKIIEILK